MTAAEEIEVMRANLKARREKNAGKRIDNSRLPAGSSMYYYCKYCDALTGVTAECSSYTPPGICVPCKEMLRLGLL